jgi:hypothetical protein
MHTAPMTRSALVTRSTIEARVEKIVRATTKLGRKASQNLKRTVESVTRAHAKCDRRGVGARDTVAFDQHIGGRSALGTRQNPTSAGLLFKRMRQHALDFFERITVIALALDWRDFHNFQALFAPRPRGREAGDYLRLDGSTAYGRKLAALSLSDQTQIVYSPTTIGRMKTRLPDQFH